MKSLQECKDEVARKHGHADWFSGFKWSRTYREVRGLPDMIEEIAKLYAQEACQDQREICAKKAYIENDLHSDGCVVNRESILNAPEPTLS